MHILLDGEAKIHPGLSVHESMDDISRPQRRLLSCPNSLPIKTIPPFLSSGQGLAFQGSSLRVVNQPKGVYEYPTRLNGVSLCMYLDDWLINPRSNQSVMHQTQW